MGVEGLMRKVMEIDLNMGGQNQPTFQSALLFSELSHGLKSHRQRLLNVLNYLLEIIRSGDFLAFRQDSTYLGQVRIWLIPRSSFLHNTLLSPNHFYSSEIVSITSFCQSSCLIRLHNPMPGSSALDCIHQKVKLSPSSICSSTEFS